MRRGRNTGGNQQDSVCRYAAPDAQQQVLPAARRDLRRRLNLPILLLVAGRTVAVRRN